MVPTALIILQNLVSVVLLGILVDPARMSVLFFHGRTEHSPEFFIAFVILFFTSVILSIFVCMSADRISRRLRKIAFVVSIAVVSLIVVFLILYWLSACSGEDCMGFAIIGYFIAMIGGGAIFVSLHILFGRLLVLMGRGEMRNLSIFCAIILIVLSGALMIYGVQHCGYRPKSQSYCYWRVAKIMQSPEICAKATDQYVRESCYGVLARDMRDASVCDAITDFFDRAACKGYVH